MRLPRVPCARRPLASEDVSRRSLHLVRHFPTTREVLTGYCAAFDAVGKSRRSLQLKLKQIAKRTDLTKKIYPHALRSTSAMMFANAALSAQGLCEIMGWEDLRTAQAYIARSGRTAANEIESHQTEFVL